MFIVADNTGSVNITRYGRRSSHKKHNIYIYIY